MTFICSKIYYIIKITNTISNNGISDLSNGKAQVM